MNNKGRFAKEFLLLNNDHRFRLTSSEFKYFLAGLIEGEAALCVSVKNAPSAKFGYLVDPEFFLYQHHSGLPILGAAKRLFGSGRISKKSGSEDVWVYSIVHRRVIAEKVIPYFVKYVLPFSCKYSFFPDFVSVVERLVNKGHLQLESFIEILKTVCKLDPNSKAKEGKIELETLKSKIPRDYTPNKSE